MAGNSAPLDDPALNSELEALLAVEPSAGFNARVLAARGGPGGRCRGCRTGRSARGRAGDRAGHPFSVRWAPTLTLAGRPFASPVAFAPRIPARPAIATDPISVPAMPR